MRTLYGESLCQGQTPRRIGAPFGGKLLMPACETGGDDRTKESSVRIIRRPGKYGHRD